MTVAINRSGLEWEERSFVASMMTIFFERSYRENRGWLSARMPYLLCYLWWKLLREELQGWLFLFPRHLTAMTVRVTQPLRATAGQPTWEQPVLHSSLDPDSR